MTNQLAEFPRTHNAPPLAERMAEELAPYRARADKLIEVAKTSIIIDDNSAAKVTDLIGMMLAVGKDLEEMREAEVRPHLEAQRLVNSTIGAIAACETVPAPEK